MRKNALFLSPFILAASLAPAAAGAAQGSEAGEARAVSTSEGQAPSDAIVLFDGSGLDEWESADGSGPALWPVGDGAMTADKGNIVTRRRFADMQIHLEFFIPVQKAAEGQHLVNSGIYIHRNYEIQILDSYQTGSDPVLSCGAVYQRNAPLVNACRRPGVWQSFDIVFHAPRFDGAGKLVAEDATVTMLFNGVLVQDHVKIKPTGGASKNPEVPRGPILLQYHD
ncbi:MAG: DUF1080 domain-containing protein, partial [Candidatus Glassbacteria bacterium]|nr:DUF1080 domain-containing protein [Candidatus Glassbacteria bacterium]